MHFSDCLSVVWDDEFRDDENVSHPQKQITETANDVEFNYGSDTKPAQHKFQGANRPAPFDLRGSDLLNTEVTDHGNHRASNDCWDNEFSPNTNLQAREEAELDIVHDSGCL